VQAGILKLIALRFPIELGMTNPRYERENVSFAQKIKINFLQLSTLFLPLPQLENLTKHIPF